MLQRIQTIYLLLAFIAVVVGIFFPIVDFGEDALIHQVAPLGLTYSGGETQLTGPLGIPAVTGYLLIGFLLFIQIFQYKHRKRQMAIGRWLYLLATAQIVFNYLLCGGMSEPVDYWGLAFFAPVVVLPFVFLANRAIKKDEELVRSIDRLR